MTFIVIMDRPGKVAARQFYRELNRAIKGGYKIERIQQSVYLTDQLKRAEFLAGLGKKYGFRVRVFAVAEEIW